MDKRSNSELMVKVAARLYNMRDTAKKFFGKEYREKLKPYTHLIQAHMKANGVDEIVSVIKLAQMESVKDNAMSQMLFFAAAVELIEPSSDI